MMGRSLTIKVGVLLICWGNSHICGFGIQRGALPFCTNIGTFMGMNTPILDVRFFVRSTKVGVLLVLFNSLALEVAVEVLVGADGQPGA